MNQISKYKETHSEKLYRENPNIYNFLLERGNDIYLEFLLLGLSSSLKPGVIADVSMFITPPQEIEKEFGSSWGVRSEVNNVFVEIISDYGMNSISYELYNERYDRLELEQMEEIHFALQHQLTDFVKDFITYCVKAWSILGYTFGYFGEIVNPMFEEVW